MADRTVAVTGASGFVGSAVVRELLTRGYRVRGLVRSRTRAGALPRDERLSLVSGSGTDADALRELTAGAWGCVNAIGILREAAGGQTFRRCHIETPRLLTEACRHAGVARFIQTSALGVSAEGRTAYQKSKYEGEQIVKRSGLTWTILRPALIHGAGSGFLQMAKGWVKGEKQPWFFLPYFTRGVVTSDVPLAAVRREAASVAPVAVEDVAWAAAESLERPEAAGEILNLVGPDTLTWPRILEAIRDAVPAANPRLEPLGIPAEAASIQAKMAAAIGMSGLLPFDDGMPIMGSEDSVSERQKARALLGFNPRPFEPALRAYASRL